MKIIDRNKIKKWIKRYGPAEIVCTTFAMLSATALYSATKNDILTALAGTWAENVGFYGTIAARDIHTSRKYHKNVGLNYSISSFFKNVKDLIVEFGPAEVIDSFISRPFMMYIFPKITGNIQIGIFAGKIAADIIMYIPVIISYEFQQMRKTHKK